MPTETVQPGDMRKPISIQQRSDKDSPSGGDITGYTPLFGAAKVWAKDKHGRAKWFDSAGRLVTTIYHTYTIRYNRVVVAGMYVVDPDYPQPMFIQGVTDPLGNKQWMELACTDIEG